MPPRARHYHQEHVLAKAFLKALQAATCLMQRPCHLMTITSLFEVASRRLCRSLLTRADGRAERQCRLELGLSRCGPRDSARDIENAVFSNDRLSPPCTSHYGVGASLQLRELVKGLRTVAGSGGMTTFCPPTGDACRGRHSKGRPNETASTPARQGARFEGLLNRPVAPSLSDFFTDVRSGRRNRPASCVPGRVKPAPGTPPWSPLKGTNCLDQSARSGIRNTSAWSGLQWRTLPRITQQLSIFFTDSRGNF
jgi:hypothetical protein